MSNELKTDVCRHCGASKGLHHYRTFQCPLNGREETRFDQFTGKYFPQQWEETSFEDSAIANITNEAVSIYQQTGFTPRQLADNINELKRRHQIILSEPNGIVRDSMIADLFKDL